MTKLAIDEDTVISPHRPPVCLLLQLTLSSDSRKDHGNGPHTHPRAIHGQVNGRDYNVLSDSLLQFPTGFLISGNGRDIRVGYCVNRRCCQLDTRRIHFRELSPLTNDMPRNLTVDVSP